MSIFSSHLEKNRKKICKKIFLLFTSKEIIIFTFRIEEIIML